MDWLGTALIVSELVLVVSATTDSAGAPHQWKTPYVYIYAYPKLFTLQPR